MTRWRKFLSTEIEIEFKAALYFYSILLFYFAYRFFTGRHDADIIVIIEMIICTYSMGYVQVFLLKNFDESEVFTCLEAVKIFFCSLIYTAVSYLCGWFDRNVAATAVFLLFMFICYACAYWLYSVRRVICTKQMNKELENFKKKSKCIKSKGNE